MIKLEYFKLFRLAAICFVIVVSFSCNSDATIQEVNKEDIVENIETVEHQPGNRTLQQPTAEHISQDDKFLPPYEIDNMAAVKSAILNVSYFNLELAVTPEERSKGLKGWRTIDENQAMLFVYGKDVEPIFWMKNTSMPLDLIFIDSKGKIESIHPMETQIGIEDRELETYTPGKPIRYAIEIKGGLAEEIGITIGSIILFK